MHSEKEETFMTCPTIDKLSCYADDLLTGEDLVEVRGHVENCSECQEIIDVFKGEAQFIQETLKEPTLPDNFAAKVLNQIEPKKKTRKKVWGRGLGVVAGLVLVVGIGAAISPGFASQIGGLFSSETVDNGLQIAEKSGLTERVNLEVTDKGITFKIEDMIVDSSRIALSHQYLNAKGQAIEIFNFESEERVTTMEGREIETDFQGWTNHDNYGLFEFSLPYEDLSNQVMVHLHITKINGVKGDWQLEVPIEMENIKDKTTIFSLNDMAKDVNNVAIRMKEVQYAPSSNRLIYETGYTAEEMERINNEVKVFEEKYDINMSNYFMFGARIHYHMKNEKDEVIARSGSALEGDKSRSIQSSGKYLEESGHLAQIDVFEPEEEYEQLIFVLDGVEKVVPVDFSIEVNQAELKKQPITFGYEGNRFTIKSIEKEVDYYFEKSLIPIKRQKYFQLKLEMESEQGALEFNNWAIIDENGQAHEAYMSGSNEEMTLSIYGFDKLPENFTLQLLTKTVYEEVEDKWEVPLYK